MTVRRPVAGRRRSLRAVALVAALLGSLLAGGCSSGTPEAAPSLKDIAALLAKHGSAVLHHDRTAFLAGLGTEGKATAFRGRQEDVFDNLARLPLASWSYTADRPHRRPRGRDGGNQAVRQQSRHRPHVVELRAAGDRPGPHQSRPLVDVRPPQRARGGGGRRRSGRGRRRQLEGPLGLRAARGRPYGHLPGARTRGHRGRAGGDRRRSSTRPYPRSRPSGAPGGRARSPSSSRPRPTS